VGDDVLEWGDGDSVILEFEGAGEDVDSGVKGDGADIRRARSTPPTSCPSASNLDVLVSPGVFLVQQLC